MPIYNKSYDQDYKTTGKPRRLFGRERPIHHVLGDGIIADVLLWKKKKVSAALLIGMTILWLLFEVYEYNFVTLLCHISITAMLVFFIWNTSAETFNLTPPRIPDVLVREFAFREAVSTFHRRINKSMSKLFDIACGRDLPLFLLVIFSLYILSLIGTYFSFINLLYFSFVCMGTLPFLYEKFEDDVDHLSVKAIQEIEESYSKLESKFLNKIPRGPVKEKKFK